MRYRGVTWKILDDSRGGNRVEQVGFGFGSGRSGQFDLLEEIRSGRVRSRSGRIGSIYILYFFRSLIDFDLIKSNLISGRVGSGLDRVWIGSDQFDF
jgi:hypothetical protein